MELEYLEYHVSHHCNLNCKGCGHLSNLVWEASFGSIDQYRKDLLRLRELFDNIKTIRLMGGEPLLNPECDRFICETRNIFPKTRLLLVTNGLRIPKMGKVFFEVVRSADCTIQVSMYEPTRKMIDEIQKICEQEEVKLEKIPVSKEMFFKQLDLHGKNDPDRSFSGCYSQKCTYLEDGKLSVCCAPLLSHRFSGEFYVEIAVDSEDYIDIWEKDITAGQILEMLNHSIPFCRYCSENKQWFQWQKVGHKVALEDWVINS